MKAIMKTMKQNIVIIVMAAAFALPAMAIEFGNIDPYAASPKASFHSTSTMIGSGSTYSANPTLNSDGTAYYGDASPAPGHRPGSIKRDGDPFGGQTIGETTNPNEPGTPLGDALLPLLLLAGIYAVMALRRRKRVEM